MEEKMLKVLHLLGIDTLLWGLFEKITLGLTKKLTEIKAVVEDFLNQAFACNGTCGCIDPKIA